MHHKNFTRYMKKMKYRKIFSPFSITSFFLFIKTEFVLFPLRIACVIAITGFTTSFFGKVVELVLNKIKCKFRRYDLQKQYLENFRTASLHA